MKRYILIILVSINLGSFAQNNIRQSVSIFADIQFENNVIIVKMNNAVTGYSMQPKILYKNVVISLADNRHNYYKKSDIDADMERIKSSIQFAEITSLNADKQDKLLRQIALSLIWNKEMNLNADIIQTQINKLELYSSGKNKENLHLIIKLYHQVFGGE